MMKAYRLGFFEGGAVRDEREAQKHSPQGPRLSLSQASQLALPPDGTCFPEASEAQVRAYFSSLVIQAGCSPRFLQYVLAGLDLDTWLDRWFALNELLELGSIRQLVSSSSEEQYSPDERRPSALSIATLSCLVAEYGLSVSRSCKPDGTAYVYAQRNGTPRVRIYLCSLEALQRGQLTEEQVRQKLTAHPGADKHIEEPHE